MSDNEIKNVTSSKEVFGNLSNKAQFILLAVVCSYCVLQVISNLIGGRLIALPFGLYTTGACLLFPFVGILNDITSNCFGSSVMKKTATIGICLNIVFAIICTITILWPSPVFFDASAWVAVLTQSVRIVIAGIIALWFSTMVNTKVLQKIKKKQVSEGKSTVNRAGIFYRAYISSIPSVICDSVIFLILSWIGTLAFTEILVMIATQIVAKLLVELVLQIPISTALIPYVVKHVGIDVVDESDEDSSLNPFKA